MSSFIGPALPPHLQRKTDSDESNGANKSNDSCDSVIGPSMPPELSCPVPPAIEPEPPNIGPSLPPHLCTSVPSPPESEDNSVGPALPSHLRESSNTKDTSQMLPSKGSDEDDESVLILDADVSDEEDDPPDEMYGPALPPGLKAGSSKQSNRDVVGPSLPPGMKLSELDDQSSDDDDDIVGPLPLSKAGDSSSYIQEQLNERALRMKRKLAGEDDVNAGPMKRESWMLELPPDRAADFGLGPRQFRKRAKPELGDRSVWTDTPTDRLQKKETPGEKEKSDEAADLEMRVIDERDKEMQRLVEKHSGKKRQESLLETHQKEIKKKKKKEKEEGKKQERRPFDRDVDLQANRFDEAQKKAIFKKAQHLNDRFSSGQSKFL